VALGGAVVAGAVVGVASPVTPIPATPSAAVAAGRGWRRGGVIAFGVSGGEPTVVATAAVVGGVGGAAVVRIAAPAIATGQA